MKIVITGATGNVGTSLLRVLAHDQRVTEIVGIARRLPNLHLDKTRFIKADVAEDELRPIFEGADAVVHLAWIVQPERDPAVLERVNVVGSERVFKAAGQARVPALIHASSVGAYAPGPKDRTVEETWETTGIPTSIYSQQKARVERILTQVERQYEAMRVVRLRPGLIFKRGAGTEMRRYFIGPLAPGFLFNPARLFVVPDIDGLRFQCVHSLDVAQAYRQAVLSDVSGAFNIAAEPPIDATVLARLFEARRVRLPPRLARAVTATTYRLHLQRSSPGWLDLALQAPLMDTFRARHELGWKPQWTATQALLELLDGIHHLAGIATPPLEPARGGAQPI